MSALPVRVCLLALTAMAMATGCAHRNTGTEVETVSATNQFLWSDNQSWTAQQLPGKRATKFSRVRMDGRDAMLAVADSSASMLRKKIRLNANELQQVRFSWKVPMLIDNADVALRDSDDAPVRLVLAFEGDRSNWSTKNTMLSELSRTITGEELPYATLMYVWSNEQAVGSVVHNPRTDRIRKIVVESGKKNLGQWIDYERDVKADFQRAFGEAPGALVGVALMTDTDNTRSQSKAYYGPVSLRAAP
jgi:Protein of unknown function (DUF3047)